MIYDLNMIHICPNKVQTMTGHSFGHHPTANVPFMFERGQTLYIYLHLQIAETKYNNNAAQFLGLKVKFKHFFSLLTLQVFATTIEAKF